MLLPAPEDECRSYQICLLIPALTDHSKWAQSRTPTLDPRSGGKLAGLFRGESGRRGDTCLVLLLRFSSKRNHLMVLEIGYGDRARASTFQVLLWHRRNCKMLTMGSRIDDQQVIGGEEQSGAYLVSWRHELIPRRRHLVKIILVGNSVTLDAYRSDAGIHHLLGQMTSLSEYGPFLEKCAPDQRL